MLLSVMKILPALITSIAFIHWPFMEHWWRVALQGPLFVRPIEVAVPIRPWLSWLILSIPIKTCRLGRKRVDVLT